MTIQQHQVATTPSQTPSPSIQQQQPSQTSTPLPNPTQTPSSTQTSTWSDHLHTVSIRPFSGTVGPTFTITDIPQIHLGMFLQMISLMTLFNNQIFMLAKY